MILAKPLLIVCWGMIAFIPVYSQLTTYTVDLDFNSQGLFRSSNSLTFIEQLENQGFLACGFFEPQAGITTTLYGLGRITSSGAFYPQWGGAETNNCYSLVPFFDDFLVSNFGGANRITSEGYPWSEISEDGDNWGDYFKVFNWEQENPYQVSYVFTTYVQDDNRVLIGGAIATDTLQPDRMRLLSRLNADGSHDESFPPIEPFPITLNPSVMEIHRTSTGYWYISGSFQGINGHLTNHIARLTPEFEVDTTFVSPILYQGVLPSDPTVKYLDNQDRLWVTGDVVRRSTQPEDTLKLVRILPDGTIDEGLSNLDIQSVYSEEWQPKRTLITGVRKLMSNPDHFVIWGGFNRINEEEHRCITVIDEAGNIQNNYFQGDGPSQNDWSDNSIVPTSYPGISVVLELTNGDLLVGGSFSDFMGESHYSLVKLNLGVLSAQSENSLNRKLKVFPNPSSGEVSIFFEGIETGRLSIYSVSGQLIYSQMIQGEQTQTDLNHLSKGMYFVQLETDQGVATKKLVLE
jgi:hypothetical protein